MSPAACKLAEPEPTGLEPATSAVAEYPPKEDCHTSLVTLRTKFINRSVCFMASACHNISMTGPRYPRRRRSSYHVAISWDGSNESQKWDCHEAGFLQTSRVVNVLQSWEEPYRERLPGHISERLFEDDVRAPSNVLKQLQMPVLETEQYVTAVSRWTNHQISFIQVRVRVSKTVAIDPQGSGRR
jgi:hypothetical protein